MKKVVGGFTVIWALFLTEATVFAAPDLSKAQGARSSSSSSTSSGADGSEPPEASPATDTAQTRDALFNAPRRRWSIAAGMEAHTAFVQTEPNDGRARPDKLYNFYSIAPQVEITPYDQIRADFGLFQHFTADPGESGLRFSDFSARYTRYIPLFTEHASHPSIPPMKGVLVTLAASTTAPTSYSSQLRGVITVPRARIYVEKAFLARTLILGVSGFGEYYIDRYRSAEGGAANRLARYAAFATADYYMPFHRQLSVGALVNSSWTYYYGIQTASPLPYGNVGDAEFRTQPVQQIYTAEVDVRYALPELRGIRSAIALTYSVGDNSVLHDGVQHLYFGFYRRTTEAYLTLTARY